ncbi:Sulfotransferase [Heracleum sosnowskyi]|uniref:Sulfotransferase n=1 Tax=Heracleum sosnowskyi TaxID=360622 RepID=A0AAD8ILD1_9APIA|nr:Sulfotransferase [Heracleum sosnowskyi]
MESKPAQPLEQVDDNKEFEDLLSSLPREKGFMSSSSYQYQGFWYPPSLLQGVINCQKHLKPLENDIFIVTAPKSGTTWMKGIIYALMNREAHPPHTPHHPLLNNAPRDLVPFLEVLSPSEYDSVCNSPDRNARIFATHIPVVSLPKSVTASLSNCKIVYMCRDIKDNFVSLFHFGNKANLGSSPISLEDAFNLYCKGVSAPGPVWDQILGYWIESQKNPHKVLFMRYEEMKDEPKLQLRRLAKLFEIPFSLEEENSGLFIFPERCGWRLEKLASRLDEITEEKFRGSGLSL